MLQFQAGREPEYCTTITLSHRCIYPCGVCGTIHEFRKLSDANAMPGNFRGFEAVRMKTLRGETCSLGLDARTWRPQLDRAHIRSMALSFVGKANPML